MKQIQNLFLPLLLFFINISLAQTTAIPDETFEQALIDLGVDSDATVNGQVLTADIDNLVELDLSNLYDSLMYFGGTITDFTGIEDFTALEILNISNIDIYLSDDQADVFNSNPNLKEFRADDFCDDCGPSTGIPYLDFSNLVDLEIISLYNNYGDTVLNLSNPSASLENLTIDLSHDNFEVGYNRLVCIEVNDPQAADANNYPYNTWDIITEDPVNGYTYVIYNFSSNCNLSTSSFNSLNDVKVFPNPVKDKLNIENPKQISLESVNVFDMTGKRVKSFSSFDDSINIESLEQGLYFIKVMSENRTKTFKVIKK